MTEQEKVVYDLVLFDLDGTLSDSSDLIAISLQFDYKFATGKEPISIQQIKDELISGNLYDELCQMIGRKIDQEEYNKILEAHIQYQEKMIYEHLRIYDGALPLLNKLKQLNIKMGIITNRDQPSLDQHLKFLKIFDFFDLIVPMSQTERHKPYPDPIFYAMKELKITDPKRVLFVGDAQTDIQSGL
ncbi:MAG: putative HAD family hydrolase, partial [Streblomastix strix]